MNAILVPIDFSEISFNALHYAIQLFREKPLKITLLHVYGARSTALIMKNIDSVLEKDAKRRMDELLEEVRQTYGDLEIDYRIIKNHPVTAISAFGNSGKYDFVVMGTKGASGFKEVFLGSVAGGVVSKTNIPVIVVPEEHSFKPLKEIVFAVSNDPFSDDQVVEPLRMIATLHDSHIKVLHIADEETPRIEKALKAIEDLNPSVDYAFGSGKTSEDLNEYLMKDFSGMVCLIRGKKGFIDRLLSESVTLKQTFNSPVPLLILHQK